MAYKFVTREEIKQYWKDYPDDKSRVIVLASFVDRLLSERNAYREVAIKNWKMWCGEYEKATKQEPMKPQELKNESEGSVDSEAARRMESRALPVEGESK